MKIGPGKLAFPFAFVAVLALTKILLTNLTKYNSPRPADILVREDTPPVEPQPFPEEEFIPELDLPMNGTKPEKSKIPPDMNIKIYGGDDFTFKFGKSFYATEKDRQSAQVEASTPAFATGFSPNMDLKFNAMGNIGNEVDMNVNFDQKEILSNNLIRLTYRPTDEKSLLKQMDVGNMEFGFGNSRLINFRKNTFKGLGLDTTFTLGKFKLKAMGALSESQQETEIFQGERRHQTVKIAEYRYISRKYYQLEPFLYFDNIASSPSSITAANYIRGSTTALNIFTSRTSVTSIPPVNIDPGSVEIYMDSQNSLKNRQMRAAPRYLNGNHLGNYYRLREGKDFFVEYRRGRVRFTEPLPVEARVFIRYTRNRGDINTTDPSARIENGKIETYIKYGALMNEDSRHDGVAFFNNVDDVEIIHDGVVNLDVYEVRGIYDLQGMDIDQGGFSLKLFSSSNKQVSSLESMGYYSVNFQDGILEFGKREPFKSLQNEGTYIYADSDIYAIYSETQGSFVYENSKVQIQTDFTAHLRSYQLKHFNIVPSSEEVRVNGIKIPANQYFIDYQSGYFVFLNPSFSMVNNLGRIEIHYSYLPFGTLKESYLVGSRLEYRPVDELTIGAGAYYNADFQPVAMDYVGNEPRGLFIAGGDANLNLDEKSITNLANKIFQSKYSNVPAKFYAYGEYAHSFYNVNTMGNALIDNMESSLETLDVNLNAGDWSLSSTPPSVGVNQCNRAPMYYKYYYDPAHFEYGLLPYTASPSASPDYSSLAGPYNVSYGHLSEQQLVTQNNQRQVSLVLDFNYGLAPDTTLPFVGIQNRLNQTPLDLSSFSQIEFYAYLENSSGLDSGVTLFLDIGSLNEDADGNGKLSTEDIGLDHTDGDINGNFIQDVSETWDTGERNHLMDYNRSTGETEDIGYDFSPGGCTGADTRIGAGPVISGYPTTIGNGVLNSEDTNDNNQLDSLDNVIALDMSNPALQFESGSNVILPGGWRHVKIFLNPDLLTEREKAILKRTESVRLYAIAQGSGIAGKGKIFIDQIRFTGSQWKTKKEKLAGLSETPISNQSVLKVSNIDNFNSKEEYETESFLLKKRDDYEILYGKKSNSEIYTIKEGSLKLEYNLGALHEYAYVQKNLRETLDISSYKKINVWVNHRNYSASNAKLFFRVGSDESNYMEFEYPIDFQGWQKLELELDSPAGTTGQPVAKLVKYFALGIKTSSPGTTINGVSWIDDIYVSDPVVKSDFAYTYGAGIALTKPFFMTMNGLPVFSDFKTDYYRKFRNYDFRSIGETEETIKEDENNFRIQSKIFPFWDFDYSTSDFQSDASRIYNVSPKDSEGVFRHTQHRTRQELFNNVEYAPHLILALTYDNDLNSIFDIPDFSGNILSSDAHSQKYLPEVILSQETPLFLKILKLQYRLKASSTFIKKDKVESTIKPDGTVSLTPLNEKEQWENNFESVTFSIGNLSLKSSHDHSQSLLIQRNFTNDIVSQPVYGSFYFPFFEEPGNSRLEQRYNGLNFEAVYTNLWFFSPKISVDIRYDENSFRDNPERYGADTYQRLKNSSALTGLTLSIPLFMGSGRTGTVQNNKSGKIDDFNNNIILSFRRELKFQESGVPFTTQSNLENDVFGVQRIIPQLSKNTFDLIEYPFWYYFSSPENTDTVFYNARQFINDQTLALPSDSGSGYDSYYNNSLWLKEIVSLSARWLILNGVTFIADTRIGQDVSRVAIYSGLLQEGDFSYSLQFLLNLMKFLNFGFWENKANNSSLTLGFNHEIRMYIISNVEETTLKPEAALEFKWSNPVFNALNGILIHFKTGIHSFKERQYLTDMGNDPVLNNQTEIVESLYSIQKLINYNLSIELFTEIPAFKKTLESILRSTIQHNPKYSITLGADINRHEIDFFNIIQSTILDEFIMSHSLDMNLHNNVTGILDLMFVYDIRRNPDDNHIMQEIFSFRAGISAKILF